MITASLKYLIGIICCLGVLLPSLSATHIIGGEMNYACLGNNEYEISLTVYRDCFLGEAPLDDTAYVAIYDQLGTLVQTLPILLDEVESVLQIEDCLVIPPSICVETTVYVDTISLLPIEGGYHIAYQRCCRNATIQNIFDPLNTGATYDIILSEQAMNACNASPVLKAWPPTFICVNRPLVFDQSATDREGDSLVYTLCTPLEGGISLINPRPRPAFPPPYKEVRWKIPTYDLTNVLGGIPLTIDSSTGLLTGTPNTIGQFVVGICVEEYRKGELLSVTKRDFQYNVIPCQEIAANIQLAEEQCNDLTIRPMNQSIGATTSHWQVLQNDILLLESTSSQPTFTLPRNGLYQVRLVINKEESCVDSLEQAINLKGLQIKPSFEYDFSGCMEDLLLTLTNTSASPTATWTVEDRTYSVTTIDTMLSIPINYQSSLLVGLAIEDQDNCINKLDSLLFPPPPSIMETDFDWEIFNCQNNSIELKINNLSTTTNQSIIWNWVLSNGQQSSEENPVFFIDELEELELGLTAISILDSFCTSHTSKIIPAQQYISPSVEITSSSADLLVGSTIELQATYDPNYTYQWSPSELLDNPTTDRPIATPLNSTTFFVTVTDENGCTASANYELIVKEVDCSRPAIFLPNAFTPNGDGENDILYLRGLSVSEMELIIYDRWGDKVFESNQQNRGWDGTKQGTPQPAGVFGYFLFVGCHNQEEYYEQGNITLIR